MFDRIFSAALAFVLLAGGTLAIAAAMLEHEVEVKTIVQLPRVEVLGKRVVARAPQAIDASQAEADHICRNT